MFAVYCRIPVDRDNYTHYVKITAVNSLGERGARSRLHSFVVRHSVEHYKQGLTFVFLDSGLLLADFLKKIGPTRNEFK